MGVAVVAAWGGLSATIVLGRALIEEKKLAHGRCASDNGSMKLQQNQIWLKGGEYFRIVQLGRLEVQYKTMTDLLSGHGPHQQVTKKEFCRLLKGAVLLEAEALSSQQQQQQQQ